MNATAFFGGQAKPVRASAPGRLDVMGGVADYSGSLVLQMPIRQRTHAAVAGRDDGILRVRSRTLDEEVTVTPQQRDALLDVDAASRRKNLGWAAYVVGAVMEFHQAISREQARPFSGIDIWVESEVPPGRGVSASAALEMAVLRALETLWSVEIRPLDLAVIGQRAEHHWAAAPCGLMDQIASHCGVAEHLLPILCRAGHDDPAQLSPPVPVPEGWHFVGIDSGVTHQVSGDAYGRARIAAFMGLEILSRTGTGHLQPPRKVNENSDDDDPKNAFRTRSDHLHDSTRTGTGHFQPPRRVNENSDGDDPKNAFRTRSDHLHDSTYRYLTDIYANQFEPDALPALLVGEEFMARYGRIRDSATKVCPRSSYPVRAAARHPIFEHQRIQRFLELLQAGQPEEAGPLMYESHQSYTGIGLGHAATDELVNTLRAHGTEQGIHGARITGGGCGGTVCVLASEQGLETVRRIAGERQVFLTSS